MTKVLIVAYHYFPSNAIASYRPESWVKYGSRYGFYPTLVTRHWQGIENNWMDFNTSSGKEVVIERSDDAEIIRLPYRDVEADSTSFWKRTKGLSKLYYLFKTLNGHFHTHANVDHTFRSYLDLLLKERKFDCILVTVPPYALIRLISELAGKYGTPYIADCRDLWNDNKGLDTVGKWTRKQKINESIYKLYIKKWLKNASLITAISKQIANIVSAGSNTPSAVITNGYDDSGYRETIPDKYDKFTITLTGTIYPEQNMDVLLDGFNLFLKGSPKAVINFIGLSQMPGIVEKVKNRLPSTYINITDRVPKQDAIKINRSSDVLFYAGWLGYKGIYSGKIFDYLAARKNILIAPGDHDVIDELVDRTRAGVSCDTPEEVHLQLQQWYEEWQKSGYISYKGIESEIRQYSREEQAKLMAQKIKDVVTASK